VTSSAVARIKGRRKVERFMIGGGRQVEVDRNGSSVCEPAIALRVPSDASRF
jgi:hypothetical protein